MPAANQPEIIGFVRDMTLRWPCRQGDFLLPETPLGAPGARNPQLFHDLYGGLAAGRVFRVHLECRGDTEAGELLHAVPVSFAHRQSAFVAGCSLSHGGKSSSRFVIVTWYPSRISQTS
jgi:hypothetical protein